MTHTFKKLSLIIDFSARSDKGKLLPNRFYTSPLLLSLPSALPLLSSSMIHDVYAALFLARAVSYTRGHGFLHLSREN